jgi:hypothetical protein
MRGMAHSDGIETVINDTAEVGECASESEVI